MYVTRKSRDILSYLLASLSGGDVRNKILSLIGAILFFAGLPVVLLNLGWEFLRREERSRVVAQQFDGLERYLTRIKREGNTQEYIRNTLGRVCGELNEEQLDATVAQRALETLKANGLPAIKLYFFDAKGNGINYPGQPREYQKIVQKLYLALSEPEAGGNDKLIQQYRSVFVSFLGTVEPTELMNQKFDLVRVVLNGKTAFFFWGTIYDSGVRGSQQGIAKGTEEPAYQGGLIAMIEEQHIDPNFALSSLLKQLNQERPEGFGFGCINVRQLDKSFPRGELEQWMRMPLNRLFSLIQRLQSQFQRFHELSDLLLGVAPYDDEKVLVGIQPQVVPLNPGLGRLIRLLSLFIIVFVGYWAWRIVYHDRQVFIPIRRKLVVLFLYSTAIPMTALGLLGYQYVTDRREVLLQGIYKKMAGFIGSLDDNFSVELDRLRSFYQRLARSKQVTVSDWEGFGAITRKLADRAILQNVFIGKADGRIVFMGHGEKSRGKNDVWAERLIPTFIRKIFSRHMPQAGFNAKNLMQDAMVDTLADSLSDALAGGGSGNAFQRIFEHSDVMHEMNLGNRINYFFTSFVRNPQGIIDRLMLILTPKKRICMRYLRSIVKRNKPRGNTEDYVRLGYVEDFGDRQVIPRELGKYAFVREMFDKVINTRTQQFSVQVMGGQSYLVVASPLKRIDEHVMLAFYPKHIVDDKVSRLTTGLLVVAAISGLFAVFIGLALSRQFLAPIQELTNGITAIEKRDFRHQIPTLDNDELGTLGVTFNQLIVNLEELHVAKIVQETLFPQERLELGDYEIHGKTRSMSDLGGDYFDYFVVDNRYLVMLIGDVTGHGVPAALLMTMAKSGISIIGNEQAIDVVKTLERLNQMMFETVKKKRIMSFFYAVLDVTQHQLFTANAGHNFPFLYRSREGSAKPIESPSYPLGARRKGVFKQMQFAIEPTDALVMYTDGLIESQNSGGQPFSYPRLEEVIAGNAVNVSSASELHERIIAEFDRYIGDRSPEDDVTMIVMRRRG